MKSFMKTHKRSESLPSNGANNIPSPMASPILNQSPTSFHSNANISNANSPKKLLIPIKNLFQKRRTSAEFIEISTNDNMLHQHDANPPTSQDVTMVRPSLMQRGSNFSENSRLSRLSDKLIPTLNSLKLNNLINSHHNNGSSHSLNHLHKNSINKSKSATSKNSSIHTKFSNFNESSDSVDSNDSKFSFVKDMKGGRNTSIKYYKTKVKKDDIAKLNNNEFFEPDHDLDVEDDYDFENNGLDDYDNNEEDINYIDDFDEPESDNDFKEFQKKSANEHTMGYDDNYSGNNYDDDNNSYNIQGGVEDYDDIDKRLVSHIEEYDTNYQDYDYDEELDEHDHDDYYIQEYKLNEDNNRKYNQAFFENESILTLPHTKVPFNHSYHLSIDGSPNNSSQDFKDNYGVLEDYFNIDYDDVFETNTNFSTNTPKVETFGNEHSGNKFENLELFDLNSPLITGLNIGEDAANSRFKNFSPNVHIARYKSKIRAFHLSIDEIDLIKSDDEFDTFSDNFSTNYSNFEQEDEVGLGLEEKLAFGDELNEENLTILNDPLYHPDDEPKNQYLPGNENHTDEEENIEDEHGIESEKRDTFNKQDLEINYSVSDQDLNKSFKSLDSKESVPKKINRQSINEMMNLLENLQIDNEQGQKNKRNSIENMMNFLQTIQKTNLNMGPRHKRNNSNTSSITKFSDNEFIFNDNSTFGMGSASGANIGPNSGTNTNPTTTTSTARTSHEDFENPLLESTREYGEDLNELEKDLIDEINQLPEDFDFDVDSNLHEELLNQFNQLNRTMKLNSFMRSNSFNKKPKKILPSSNLKSNNKIETSRKTVTYYKKPLPNINYEVEEENNLSTITEDKH